MSNETVSNKVQTSELVQGGQDVRGQDVRGQDAREQNPNAQVPCEVYSRIVGYLRPVQNWNKGKRQEFEARRTYQVKDTAAE